MAEGDDKTEPATAKRRGEARSSGQIAKSADLTAAALLLVALLMLSATAHAGYLDGRGDDLVFGQCVHSTIPKEILPNSISPRALPHVLHALVPIMLVLAGAAILIVGLQVGFHANLLPLMPNPAKLNPLRGLGRLFAGRNFMQDGHEPGQNRHRGVHCLYGFPARITWHDALFGRRGIPRQLRHRRRHHLQHRLADGRWALCCCWPPPTGSTRKWRAFERDIRMSKQEIKDEARSMDGDPQVKGAAGNWPKR